MKCKGIKYIFIGACKVHLLILNWYFINFSPMFQKMCWYSSHIEKPAVRTEAFPYFVAPILQPHSLQTDYRRDHHALTTSPLLPAMSNPRQRWVPLEMQKLADSKTLRQHGRLWAIYTLTEEQELTMHYNILQHLPLST